MKAVGISGVLVTGEISEPICQVPVDINKMGVILIGGLNPVACAQEAGIVAENSGMASVMDTAVSCRFRM
jgi:repressor of nif and glnA expression